MNVKRWACGRWPQSRPYVVVELEFIEKPKTLVVVDQDMAREVDIWTQSIAKDDPRLHETREAAIDYMLGQLTVAGRTLAEKQARVQRQWEQVRALK